jgi:cytochrome c oxidase subunit IV
MGKSVRLVVVLYIALMIALIVGLDVTLFRHRFWERLAGNVGIVLVFAALYLRFLRRP